MSNLLLILIYYFFYKNTTVISKFMLRYKYYQKHKIFGGHMKTDDAIIENLEVNYPLENLAPWNRSCFWI